MSFLFYSGVVFYSQVYHIFFIHSSVDGYLGCFWILAIVQNANNNININNYGACCCSAAKSRPTLQPHEHQVSLSFTKSWSLLKLMSIELVMSSNHLVLGRPLLLPSIFPSIRVIRAFCLEQLDKTTKKWASSYFIVSVGVIASKLLYIEIHIFTNYFSFF